MKTLSDYVDYWAVRSPDAEAAVFDGSRVCYDELSERMLAVSKSLVAVGVSKGDRVAGLQAPGIDFLVLYLAVMNVGAIWLGVNPRYQRQEISYHLQDAEPKLMVARESIGGRSYTQEISDAQCPVVMFPNEIRLEGTMAWPEFLAVGGSLSDRAISEVQSTIEARDACMLVYTSGSTGSPKGALLHHAGVLQFAREQCALWPVEPLRLVNYFPVNHIGSLVDAVAPVLFAGGCLIFMEQFDAEDCLSLMEKESVTMWVTVSSVFAMQLAVPDFESYDLSALQLIVWEGAALPYDLFDKLHAIHPRLATNYGMTETTSAITATKPCEDRDVLLNSVGEVFPGSTIRLVPDVGVGEIQVKSSANFLGYWRRDEETRQAFTDDGFFRTGDLAEQRPDGRYRIVGRLKEMYKSGGYNIYPREIESVIETHTEVVRVAVVSIPDPVWDEVGVAFVVGSKNFDIQFLEPWCRKHLANYKIPKHFLRLDALPLLPIGKVDKSALRQQALNLQSSTRSA